MSPIILATIASLCLPPQLQKITASSSLPVTSSRRAILVGAAALGSPKRAVAEATSTTVQVAEYPGIEYMEPMIELQQLMDALVDGAKDPAQWRFIRRRLDGFFSGGPGGIFSDRYFYTGVSAQYIFKIKYEGSGSLVDADKLARQETVAGAMEALQQMRTELKTPEPNAIVVLGCARRARDGIGGWLARVPSTDVERVSVLLKSVRAADANRDGQLSDAEMATLAPADRETWKARLALF